MELALVPPLCPCVLSSDCLFVTCLSTSRPTIWLWFDCGLGAGRLYIYYHFMVLHQRAQQHVRVQRGRPAEASRSETSWERNIV